MTSDGIADLDLPAHDMDAERAVIGAALQSAAALSEADEVLNAGDFYRPAHVELWTAILNLSATAPIDVITLSADLARLGILARIGGAPYLHTLIAAAPTTVNAAYYAAIVAEKATLRRLLAAGQRVVQLATNGAAGADAADVVENARQTVDEVVSNVRRSVDSSSGYDLAVQALEDYASPAPASLPTGWADLDAVLNGGLRPGTLTVIAARPGVGKTVLGANLATSAARDGVGSLLVSLEMTEQEVIDRVLSSLARVELSDITKRSLSPDDFRRMRAVAERMRDWPLHICDLSSIGVTGIRTLARNLTRTTHGLGLVIVDYLQLMHPADPRAPREQQVSSLSRGLKLLAKEMHVPVVALAQLNRGSEARSDRRPIVSDLRESGAIEADADHVLLLYRDPDEKKQHEIEVIVGKNRHGRQGSVFLSWAPYYARADNLTRLLEAV